MEEQESINEICQWINKRRKWKITYNDTNNDRNLRITQQQIKRKHSEWMKKLRKDSLNESKKKEWYPWENKRKKK